VRMLALKSSARFVLAGIAFGFVLVRGEVVSWFRIQEMFRFQAFHMYGTIVAAIVVAGVSLELLKRSGARALDGTPIALAPKTLGRGWRYACGGTVFGLGWALTGACPGPLFALLGSGASVMIVPIASALLGAWVYGWLRPHLPH
jgi:uncharacterized membrane protein YedE/YeeE